MKFTKEEFEDKFKEGQDLLLEAMAENRGVSVEKFYSMACFLENMSFFAPVLYGLIKENKIISSKPSSQDSDK